MGHKYIYFNHILIKFLKRSYRYTFIALLVSLIPLACTSSTNNLTTVSESPSESAALTIWWEKGFTLGEDEALQQLVNNWQQQSGKPVKLSLYTTDDLAQRAQRALQAGNPPDIMMSHNADQSLNPRLAWQGKLVDVSGVIEPIKDTYPPAVLEAVNFYNSVEKKRSYYGIPISQAAIFIYYWQDLLKQAGYNKSDIPRDWNGYWNIWKQVQDKLQKQQSQKIYGLGLTLSIGASDTYHFFEQVLEAFDARLLNSNGKLLIDDPTVRQRIIESLKWSTQLYQRGYVPPDAIKWLNPDNNENFLNRVVLMTPNATLSIPAAVHQDTDTYLNKLGTLELPNKPSGQPMRYVVAHRQAVTFADAKHHETAKDFLTYLVNPKTLGTFLKAGGRNLPVMKPIWDDPFWTNGADPHISVAAKILTQGQTRPFYPAYHPAYSVVLQEHVWSRALNRIIVDRIAVEQAADEAIAQIRQIFTQWQ